MKIHIIIESYKIGTTIYRNAYATEEEAAAKARQLAEDYASKMKNRYIRPEITGTSAVTVTIGGSFMASFKVAAIEMEMPHPVDSIIGGDLFSITCVSRDDLECKGFDISGVTDKDMRELADRMKDDYLSQLYWESLEIIAEDVMKIPKKSSDNMTGERQEDDGHIVYTAAETEHGRCFKDLTAFEECDRICYISDRQFDGKTSLKAEDEYDEEIGYTSEAVFEIVSRHLPGSDTRTINAQAFKILKEAQGQDIEELAAGRSFTEDLKTLYPEGSRVMLQPYNPDDECREVTVVRFDCEENILVKDDEGIDQEVVLNEIHRLSDRRCPRCGQPLYHEKWSNTNDRYPYVCFDCDENFFEIETESK